jgi:hypothetical protein
VCILQISFETFAAIAIGVEQERMAGHT